MLADSRIVRRNGVAFQVPCSNHSTRRYSVHSLGDGVGWTITETLDVDQPHGKDYQQLNHIAIGVRKRMNKEHVAFGDTTAGGEHIPGGCAVVDVLDATADLTNYMDDGTYTGGGLVWCISTGTKYGVLWICATGNGTYGAVGDPTILKLHPDKQWGGGDISWTGKQKFGSDVTVDGTVVFTGVFLDGTTTFNGVAGESGPTVKMLGDWSERSLEVTYTARTDGFVHVMAEATNGDMNVSIHTPYGTERQICSICTDGWQSLMCAVKGGNTWAVAADSSVNWDADSKIYWIPLGDNS